MIYSAGECPVCLTGESIFLKSVSSGRIFYTCDECMCAWGVHHSLHEVDTLEPPETFAPDGYSLANAEEIKAAGLKRWIFRKFSDDDLRFDSEPNFHPPYRNPADYDGKTIAVTLAQPLSNGRKAWAILSGIGRCENGILYLYPSKGHQKFELRQEWLSRIKRVSETAPAPYCESEFNLSLARNAFANDTPPPELMKMAQKVRGE